MKNSNRILVAMALFSGISCVNANPAAAEQLTNVDSKVEGTKKNPVKCRDICSNEKLYFNGQHWHNEKTNSVVCQCTNIKENEKQPPR